MHECPNHLPHNFSQNDNVRCNVESVLFFFNIVLVAGQVGLDETGYRQGVNQVSPDLRQHHKPESFSLSFYNLRGIKCVKSKTKAQI